MPERAPTIADRLVAHGVITPEQRVWAEAQPRPDPGGVASVLLEAGLVTEAQLVAVAADRLGVGFVDLDADPPDPSNAALLAAATARRAGVVPVGDDSSGLVVAMADPTDGETTAWLADQAGRPVRAVAAVPRAIARAQDRLYPPAPHPPAVGTPPSDGNPSAPRLDDLLAAAIRHRASDLHLSVGRPPGVRIDGDIWPVEGTAPLSAAAIQELVDGALSEDQQRRFADELELDASYTAEGVGRFRLNAFVQRGCVGAVLRAIPFDVPDPGSLGLPAPVSELATLTRGLVLVTGPTGSGKSTTLASLVDVINRTRRAHIMTVEDPIEFIHRHKQSVVNQREVGQDTRSFASALKHALRQDPDVILVGEMRDLETIATALTAAETGHLVLGTLHTLSAAQSIDRIVDVFPAHQQQQVRTQLATTLRGVVTQQLLPALSGGRILATEVLIVTNAVRTLIRDGKSHQITSTMQSGAKHGMETMDHSLARLVSDGRISAEVAIEHCLDEDDLGRLMGSTTAGPAPTLASSGRR
ncbi:MAG TPA: PilT/PilU family type 4a pilus ATPase [Acidimicrobiales bacterium]